MISSIDAAKLGTTPANSLKAASRSHSSQVGLYTQSPLDESRFYMGAMSKWLMHDDQQELFEVPSAGTLTILFLALIALLSWSLGRPMLAIRLAKGYGILWIVVYVSAVLVNRIQHFFRVNHVHRRLVFLNPFML